MNKIILSLFFCLAFLGFPPSALCMVKPFETIKNRIESGNIQRICEHLDNIVVVDILSVDHYFSKRQAANLIMRFFKEHPIEQFTLLSTGGDRSSNFGIGRMRSGNNFFLITCSITSDTSENFKIHSIKIEIDK